MAVPNRNVPTREETKEVERRLHQVMDEATIQVAPLLPQNHRIRGFRIERTVKGEIHVSYRADIVFEKDEPGTGIR